MVSGLVITWLLGGGCERLERGGDPFEGSSDAAERPNRSVDIPSLTTSESVTHR
jgi:hypothetical protein